ncbi:transposase, partial [Streptomyces sp. YS-3]|uniref:transposase n=1 Tax=Streptomyces sp. YS-3 TaxID=3381352 RepID=UPI003862B1BC
VRQQWGEGAALRGAGEGVLAVVVLGEDLGHGEKWLLALNILDDLAAWGLPPRVVLADAAYGTNASLCAALEDRGLGYALSVRSDVTAHPFDDAA